MPTIRVVEHSDHPPERVLEAARDFSERRAELWPDVHLKHYEVHESGDTSAEVTEGNWEIFVFTWERLSYAWSQPGSLKATVTDSNIFDPGSSWELRATPSSGGSRVELIRVANLKAVKGAIAGAIIRSGLAKPLVAKTLRTFLSRIEEPPHG